jgi:hypothetical protein
VPEFLFAVAFVLFSYKLFNTYLQTIFKFTRPQKREGLSPPPKARFRRREGRFVWLLLYLPVWVAGGVLRVVALHPLGPKVAEIQEINRAVSRGKVRILTIIRRDAIGMQPFAGNYPKV